MHENVAKMSENVKKNALKMNLGQTPTAQSGLGWCHMCRKKVDGDPYHGFVCVCVKRVEHAMRVMTE